MGRILALDANLVMLLIVGLADESVVPDHKRTRAYSVKDFKLLLEIISSYTEIAVVPNTTYQINVGGSGTSPIALAGSGGGASDVRTGGFTLGERIIVAGKTVELR